MKLYSRKIALVAKEMGINKRKFKAFIKKVSVYSGGLYTYDELLEIAKEFKASA